MKLQKLLSGIIEKMSLRPSFFRGEMRMRMRLMGYNSKIISQDSKCMFLIIDGIYVTIVFPKNILTDDTWTCTVSLLYSEYRRNFIFDARNVGEIFTEITNFKEGCQSQY